MTNGAQQWLSVVNLMTLITRCRRSAHINDDGILVNPSSHTESRPDERTHHSRIGVMSSFHLGTANTCQNIRNYRLISCECFSVLKDEEVLLFFFLFSSCLPLARFLAPQVPGVLRCSRSTSANDLLITHHRNGHNLGAEAQPAYPLGTRPGFENACVCTFFNAVY